MYYGDFVRRLKIDLNYMGMKTFLNKINDHQLIVLSPCLFQSEVIFLTSDLLPEDNVTA